MKSYFSHVYWTQNKVSTISSFISKTTFWFKVKWLNNQCFFFLCWMLKFDLIKRNNNYQQPRIHMCVILSKGGTVNEMPRAGRPPIHPKEDSPLPPKADHLLPRVDHLSSEGRPPHQRSRPPQRADLSPPPIPGGRYASYWNAYLFRLFL